MILCEVVDLRDSVTDVVLQGFVNSVTTCRSESARECVRACVCLCECACVCVCVCACVYVCMCKSACASVCVDVCAESAHVLQEACTTHLFMGRFSSTVSVSLWQVNRARACTMLSRRSQNTIQRTSQHHCPHHGLLVTKLPHTHIC